jgi:hypothetical protein
MTVTVDGTRVSVVEAGECDNPQNKKTNGDRLKNAASDAFKRCAMRLGCGLHLWSDDFFLYGVLQKRDENAETGAVTGEHSAQPVPAEQPHLAGVQ